MAFFDFFKKKPEPTEEVSFSGLDAWLKAYVDKKDLNSKWQAFRKQVEEIFKSINSALAELAQAKLINENISEKERQIMEGNRDNYVKRFSQFLEQIHIPEPFSESGFFTSKLSQDLDSLSGDTEKNFFVLKHFFDKQVSQVAVHLKALSDKLISFRKSLENEHLDEVREIGALLKQWREEEKKRQQYAEQKQEEESRLPDLKQREVKILGRLTEYKKSPAYDEYARIANEKEVLSKQVQANIQALKQDFSSLGHALRKYHYEAKDSVVQQYLDNPSEALLKDDLLHILKVLATLRQELQALDLKEDKEVKTLEAIDRLNEAYLAETRSSLCNLNEKLAEIKAQLANSIIALNILEQESLLSETKSRIASVEECLQELEQKISSLASEDIYVKIKELVPKLGNAVLVAGSVSGEAQNE